MISLLEEDTAGADLILASKTLERRIHSFIALARLPPALLATQYQQRIELDLTDKALNSLVWYLYSDELCSVKTLAPRFRQLFFGTHSIWPTDSFVDKMDTIMELYVQTSGNMYESFNMLTFLSCRNWATA